ncbi:MAG: BamA/TamA family outer membrane protein [Myxococcota bacterium]|nr:BamA/TamA family outer membrane protein [Myxococcota bacterium]
MQVKEGRNEPDRFAARGEPPPGAARRLRAFALGIALGIALIGATGGRSARAQPRDPLLTWHTIRTPHFVITYHEPLGYVARRVAAVAERAHSSLATILDHEPAERVQIVLTDDADAANGSATALPFDTIRLYAEAPDDLSPLAEYDDWMTTLVTHEHTHILHLGNASGLPSLVNLLLGRVYMPNHVQPRWFLEGLAVYEETEQTSGGRLRSAQWDMYLRMDALEERFWDIDQVSTSADRWPHGNAAYLYGSYFVRFIAERYGRIALAQIAREYGSSILPYGINRVAQRATGHTFVELWDEFLAERRAHYLAQQRAVDAIGRREGTRLTTHGELARAPRFLRDGRLMYLRADNRSRGRIMIVDRDTGEPRQTLVRVNAGGEAAVHPDGRTIVFAKTDAHRDIYFFSDLFRRDLQSGHETRLTHGLRAREPDLSPDGRHVVFTVSRAGTTQLMIAELADVPGTMRELTPGHRFQQWYTPRFSPDGRTVAVSTWRNGGYRDVLLVDVATGRKSELTHDRAQDTGPVFSGDGSIVYFSSDRTGIANIYAYHLASGSLRQVTNVIGGAYQPAIAPDGEHMVYVGYTSYGFDLFSMEIEPTGFRDAPAYVDTRPTPSDTESIWTAESEDYEPLATLYPRSYFLDLSPDSFGTTLGISVAGEDVVGWHRWRARLGFGLVRGNMSVDAAYSYNRLPLAISLRGFRYVTQAGGLELAGRSVPWIQEAFGGDLSLGYSFPRAFSGNSVSLSYALTYTQPADPYSVTAPDPNFPAPILPETGRFSTLRFGWSYSDVERYAYDISPSNGRSLGIGLSLADPAIGSQFRVLTLTWSITQYLPMPWGESHVMALRYAGGISGGDLERQGLFGVGGFPTVGLISGFTDPIILGGAALRGYNPNDRVGNQYHLAQIEYRFLIARFNRGVLTLPVYLNRLWATVFADGGDAFRGDIDLSRFRVGVGGELHLDFTLFYLLGFSLRVGYARGLSEGGIDQVYGHLGVPF